MVTRPASGTKTVGFQLWGNDSGRISTTETDVTTGWKNLPGVTSPTPFTVDFNAKVTRVDGAVSTASLSSVGVALDKMVDAGKETKTRVKAGKLEDDDKVPTAADIAKALKDKTTGSDVAEDPRSVNNSEVWITNAWGHRVVDGKPTGNVTYCEQKTSRSDAESTSYSGVRVPANSIFLHFIAFDGNGIIKVPDPALYASLAPFSSGAKLGAGAGWPTQSEWVALWNKTYSHASIKLHRQLHSTSSGVPLYYLLPLVECTTEEVEETIQHRQGMTISTSASHCGSSVNKSVTLQIYVPAAEARTRNPEVIPPIANNGKVGSTNVAAMEMLTITCPASSANRGRELVPDNSWNPLQR